MYRFQSALADAVAGAIEVPLEEVEKLIKIPEAVRGDFSLPCFPFAKAMRKNPAAIAADIAGRIAGTPGFEKIEAVGPYVNAAVSGAAIIETVVPEAREKGEAFGCWEEGAGRVVVVESSSPNIAKPLGFHHLRSTMIGHSLARIHEAMGYRVARLNFLGDWGKTFGLLAEAFTRFGDLDRLREEGIAYLLELYVKANELLEEEPGLDEAARAMFVRQEEGDPEALELWELFREISLAEFDTIYSRLGVAFDAIEGESRYRDGMDEVVERVSATAGTREDQGALVVDMEYGENEPPMMLRKSDGATLYATRDLAAAIDRFERFAFAKSVYVVGSEQRLHFEQLKRGLLAMGFDWATRMIHVQFGRIHGMSTRKGKVVFLRDVLDEARDRAAAKMRETGVDQSVDLDAVSEQVGVGGVVFGDLKNLKTSDYTFDWDEILNTKGFTGICVQYAHARCCSILRRAGGVPDGAALGRLGAPEEAALVKDIARIPSAIKAAAAEMEPSRLARVVYEAARSWNRYQQAGNSDRSLRILADDEETRAARLVLVDAVRIALARGLYLLGVPSPESM